MYAVVKTGGKQYKVSSNDVIYVEKLIGNPGDKVTLSEVLMVGGNPAHIGTPTVKGASVVAEIVEQLRDEKVIIFKKRRRHNYRRTKGHRQYLTALKIRDIKLAASGKAKAEAAE